MNKKRIAFVIDLENWAFDIEAKLLKNKLKDYYDIDIFAATKYDDDLFSILEDTKDYDMIHFFWRKLLVQFTSEEFKRKLKDNNIDYQGYIDKIANKISTGIYDHLFLEEENLRLYKPIFNNYCKSYYTCSKKLEEIYKSLKDFPKPWGTIHDTYDNKLYNGGDKLRFKDKSKNDPLVIGWIGNSKWNIKYKDFKGFHSVLNPAIDELINEGYLIERNFADKNIVFRTNEEMPSYYQEIDVCIVVSLCEGTPRPIIEAMASGVPIITTDVGIVKEVLGPLQKEYIIGDRNINDDESIKNNLKEKIKKIYNDRNILEELSEENYMYAPKNDIDHTYLEYKKYFDEFLN